MILPTSGGFHAMKDILCRLKITKLMSLYTTTISIKSNITAYSYSGDAQAKNGGLVFSILTLYQKYPLKRYSPFSKSTLYLPESLQNCKFTNKHLPTINHYENKNRLYIHSTLLYTSLHLS